MVQKHIKRWKEEGTWEDRKHSGRPVTSTTEDNIAKVSPFNVEQPPTQSPFQVENKIARNPECSMRKMGKELGINEKSVRRIVKKLGMRSYRLTRGHLLKEDHKDQRLQKAAKMRTLVNTSSKLERVVFTDEKVSTVMRHHNRQNDRIIATKGLKIKRPVLIKQVQKPAAVMVWAGVCATGRTKLTFIK